MSTGRVSEPQRGATEGDRGWCKILDSIYCDFVLIDGILKRQAIAKKEEDELKRKLKEAAAKNLDENGKWADGELDYMREVINQANARKAGGPWEAQRERDSRGAIMRFNENNRRGGFSSSPKDEDCPSSSILSRLGRGEDTGHRMPRVTVPVGSI